MKRGLQIIMFFLVLLLTISVEVNAQEIEGSFVKYRTQIENFGWQDWFADGDISGTEGRGFRLEGIEITSNIDGVGIEYVTHIQNVGWEDEVYGEWKTDGEMSGTEGKGLRLEAIKIQLTGENSENYDVYYRVHTQNIGWMSWVSNGADAGTTGLSYRLEGIEIRIIPRKNTLVYRGYLDNIGEATQFITDSRKWDLSKTSESCGSETGTKTIRGIHIYWDYNFVKPEGLELTYYVYYKDSNGVTKNYYSYASDERHNYDGVIYKEGYPVTNLAFKLSGKNSDDYDIFYKALYIGENDWRDWIKEGDKYKNSGEMQSYKIVLVPAGSLPIEDSSNKRIGTVADTDSGYKGGYVTINIDGFGDIVIPLTDGECYFPEEILSYFDRSGYTLEGFYYNPEFTDEFYLSTPITSDIILYCHYVAKGELKS